MRRRRQIQTSAGVGTTRDHAMCHSGRTRLHANLYLPSLRRPASAGWHLAGLNFTSLDWQLRQLPRNGHVAPGQHAKRLVLQHSMRPTRSRITSRNKLNSMCPASRTAIKPRTHYAPAVRFVFGAPFPVHERGDRTLNATARDSTQPTPHDTTGTQQGYTTGTQRLQTHEAGKLLA